MEYVYQGECLLVQLGSKLIYRFGFDFINFFKDL